MILAFMFVGMISIGLIFVAMDWIETLIVSERKKENEK